MEKPEDLQVSSPEEITAKVNEVTEGKVVELPSGLRFKIARPALSDMIKKEVIPAALIDAAMKIDSESYRARTREEALQMYKVIDITIINAVKAPKIVEGEPKTGEVSVDQMTNEDKLFIFTFVQAGVTNLRPFRDIQTGDSTGLSSPSVSGLETVPAGGNRG